MFTRIRLCLLSIFISLHLVAGQDGTFTNKIRFPFSEYYDPFIGILVAFDLKLVPSEIDADLSWNIEANYLLPQNESEYTFPPIVTSSTVEKRSFLDRFVLYKIIESKLESFSKPHEGRYCLLRMICEMALYTTKDTDILGDLLHIILSPSSSSNKHLPSMYSNAEAYGRKYHHCQKYVKKCPISVLDFFSVIGNLLEYTLRM